MQLSTTNSVAHFVNYQSTKLRREFTVAQTDTNVVQYQTFKLETTVSGEQKFFRMGRIGVLEGICPHFSKNPLTKLSDC